MVGLAEVFMDLERVINSLISWVYQRPQCGWGYIETRHILTLIYDFQLVDALEPKLGMRAKVEFRRAGDPIDGEIAFDRDRAVGFHLYELARSVA